MTPYCKAFQESGKRLGKTRDLGMGAGRCTEFEGFALPGSRHSRLGIACVG